jgi:hypothetical protein
VNGTWPRPKTRVGATPRRPKQLAIMSEEMSCWSKTLTLGIVDVGSFFPP